MLNRKSLFNVGFKQGSSICIDHLQQQQVIKFSHKIVLYFVKSDTFLADHSAFLMLLIR